MNQTSRHLPDRTVVITGASAGVDRAVAPRFAKAGANLALIARDAAARDAVKQEAEKLGGSALVVPPMSLMPIRYSTLPTQSRANAAASISGSMKRW